MRLVLALVAAPFLLTPAQAQLAPPNAAGVSMGHVHLNVKDIDAQRTFWTTQFGAHSLKREGLNGVMLPGMMILFSKRDYSGGSEGTMMDHFGLKVPSLSAALKHVRDAGFTVQREFKGTEGFPNAYIFGPDEVKVELQEDVALAQPAIAYHLHFMNGAGDQLKLLDWYAKTFSAVVKKRGEHDAADLPGINLTFGIARKPPTIGTKGRSIDHIGFEVKNLEAFCKKLEANGIKLDVAYRKIPTAGISLAFLTDPFGTYIELTEGLDQY